jgi:hypothetical protein
MQEGDIRVKAKSLSPMKMADSYWCLFNASCLQSRKNLSILVLYHPNCDCEQGRYIATWAGVVTHGVVKAGCCGVGRRDWEKAQGEAEELGC